MTKQRTSEWNHIARAAADRAARERSDRLVESSFAVRILAESVDDPFFGRRAQAELLEVTLLMFETERVNVERAAAKLETTLGKVRWALEAGVFGDSGFIQHAGSDVDVATGRLAAVRDAALATCRLLRVYCPALWSETERAARARRSRYAVEAQASGVWWLLMDGQRAAGMGKFQSEEQAWLAFDAVTS